MKVGDLVKTTGFGPDGSCGEIGLLIHRSRYRQRPRLRWCWEVLFNSGVHVVAEDGLEVVNESR